MRLSDLARTPLAVIVGAALYVPGILLPVAGPLFSGYVTGRIAGNGARGFATGLFSSLLGFLAWALIMMYAMGLRLDSAQMIVLWWIFACWNLLCVALSTVGGLFGGSASGAKAFFSQVRRDDIKGVYAPEDAETLVICPSCGGSNKEKDEICVHCGGRLG